MAVQAGLSMNWFNFLVTSNCVVKLQLLLYILHVCRYFAINRSEKLFSLHCDIIVHSKSVNSFDFKVHMEENDEKFASII